MKKLLAMLVAFTLILALAFCGPSASADLVLDPETSSRPEDNVVGVWFFQLEETILRLELLPDVFTIADARRVRQQQGLSNEKGKCEGMIRQWLFRKYALRVTDYSFKKCH